MLTNECKAPLPVEGKDPDTISLAGHLSSLLTGPVLPVNCHGLQPASPCFELATICCSVNLARSSVARSGDPGGAEILI